MALFAIGDIHGCARTLDALLDELAPSSRDSLVFLGDYVDRGPDSYGVIERLIRLEEDSWSGTGPLCIFLRGNHDQMMLDFLGGCSDGELWRANGAGATLESYSSAGFSTIPEAHVAFLNRTHFVYDTPEFTFVHAGLAPGMSVEDNVRAGRVQTFLWSREHIGEDRSAWEKTVVVGHTPVRQPINEPNFIAIDTGAVFAGREGLGRLTAVALPERRFISVETVD